MVPRIGCDERANGIDSCAKYGNMFKHLRKYPISLLYIWEKKPGVQLTLHPHLVQHCH